jgi:hypothetical protein
MYDRETGSRALLHSRHVPYYRISGFLHTVTTMSGSYKNKQRLRMAVQRPFSLQYYWPLRLNPVIARIVLDVYMDGYVHSLLHLRSPRYGTTLPNGYCVAITHTAQGGPSQNIHARQRVRVHGAGGAPQQRRCSLRAGE